MTLWGTTAQLTNNACAGIEMGTMMRIDQLGLVGQLCLHKPTVKDALETYIQYHQILQGGILLELKRGETDSYEHSPLFKDLIMPRAINDTVIIATCNVVKTIVGDADMIQVAQFMHSQPDSIQEYEQVLGNSCKLIFDAPGNAIHFNKGVFDVPMPQSNEALAEVLGQYAEKTLAELPNPGEPLIVQINSLIAEGLPEGKTTIEYVAKELGYGVRSLQRKLQEKEMVFSDLVKSIKQNLAQSYLKDMSLNIAEIAFMLGFSEPGAFTRAFNSWYGLSPKAYRQKL